MEKPGMYPPLGQPTVTKQPMPVTHTSTIVVSQPVGVGIGTGWHSGLCDCFQDLKSCLCTFFLGECYFACLAARMGENCCVGFGGVPGGHLAMRVALRSKHGIPGSICDDCCMMTCCFPCAMCQLAREMDALNYAPKDSCC